MYPRKLFGAGLLCAAALSGCTAIKSTVELSKAEQAVLQAAAVEASSRAPYEWTMTEQAILKAREEWGYADYGPAERFSKEASRWAALAVDAAETSQRTEMMDRMPDNVPEDAPQQKSGEPDLMDDPDLWGDE